MSEENADYWNKIFVETSNKIDELFQSSDDETQHMIATMWAYLDNRLQPADLPAVFGYIAGRTGDQVNVLGRFVVLHAALRGADLHMKKANKVTLQ
jgi:hypothetical protein